MIKYCLDKWNKNSEKLEEVLSKDKSLNNRDYRYLVELVVKHILNDDDNGFGENWDSDNITIIDDGHYQGTLLFAIPRDTYQPAEYEYLMTYVSYGSCSGCDALQSIQGWESNVPPTTEQLKDYMTLCRDLVCNMVRPFKSGWREMPEFDTVVME